MTVGNSSAMQPDWLRDVRPVVLGALVAYGIALAAYFFAFGSAGCCDQASWGQFGDFIGGIVNPLLGLVSVFLLAQTLREQRRLIKESKDQAVIEELQRLLTSTSKRLDETLAEPVDPQDIDLGFLFEPSRAVAPRRTSYRGQNERPRRLLEVMREACSRLQGAKLDMLAISAVVNAEPIQEAFRGLVRLDECLREFLQLGGDPVIGRLYGSQYAEPALLLSGVDSLAEFPPGYFDFPAAAMERLGLEARMKQMESGLARCQAELKATFAAMDSYDQPPN